jgi:hypothetical protein
VDVASKWYELGLQLEVKESDLKNIEHDYGSRGIQACLREMLSEWLKQIDPCPSWEKLLSSIRHSTVGNPALAQKIGKEVGILESIPVSATHPSKQAGKFTIPCGKAMKDPALSFSLALNYTRFTIALSTVAFEATRSHLDALLLAIKDPDIIACALNSVDIISNEVLEKVAEVPTTTETDVNLFQSQVEKP